MNTENIQKGALSQPDGPGGSIESVMGDTSTSPLSNEDMLLDFQDLKDSLNNPNNSKLENIAHTAEKIGNMAAGFAQDPKGYMSKLGDKLTDRLNQKKDDLLNKSGLTSLKKAAGAAKAGNKAEALNNLKQGLTQGATNSIGNVGKMLKGAGGAALNATGGIGGQGGNGKGDQMANDFSQEAKKAMDEVRKVAKTVAALGRAAGGDVSALLDPEVIKTILKMAMLAIAIPIIIIFSIIGLAIMLIKWLATSIVGALFKVFESFNINDIATAVGEAINPVVYDEWTMDAEYEMIADAFGNDVQEAYAAMMEDIQGQIDSYQANATYNEWEHILNYNNSVGQISFEFIQSGSNIDNPIENGMPLNTNVYIGGYTGSTTDSEWGINGLGSSVDSNSKTDPNYNKGLYKKDTTNYATGTEPFFDAAATSESVQGTLGYAAISDMAYIVAGYNVSRYEQPIYDTEGSLTKLAVGMKVLSYKLDIARNIFAQNIDNSGVISGTIQTILDAIEDSLGVNTYFSYDPDEVKIVPSTATRIVYEYSEKLYTAQDYHYAYTYTYEYNCQDSFGCAGWYSCPGTHTSACTIACSTPCTADHSYSCGGCVPHYGCTGHVSDPQPFSAGPTHEEIVNGHTYSSSFTSSQADYKPDSSEVGAPSYAYNISVSDGTLVYDGNSYPLNRSEYLPVEKTYTSYVLDIPTSAFDCDKLLKAMFEQSPYFKQKVVTSYTTELEPERVITDDDEVIDSYGGYVWRWKYSAKDENIEFTDADGSSITQTVAKGDAVPNGIHAMPYRGSDIYYLYECTGHSEGTILSLNLDSIVNVIVGKHSFGPGTTCSTCGAVMWETDLEGESEMDTDRKSTITGIGQYVHTTTEKLTIEKYTGKQTGGNVVILEPVELKKKNDDGETVDEYYVITIYDRVLSNKDTVMNVLDNAEEKQAQYASVGNSASYVYGGTIDYTPLIEYTSAELIDTSKYGSVTINDGKYMLGIGNWKGDDAILVISSIIVDNPALLTSLCASESISEEDFKSNWSNISHADAAKYKTVLEGLLNSSTGTAIQNEKYNEKIQNLITFWQGKGVSDGSTIVLLTSLASYVDDASQLATGGGAYATFRDYIVNPAIAAGVAESLETAYNGYLSFCGLGNNLGLGSSSIQTKINSLYTKLITDRESGNVPFLFVGELTPDNLVPLINNLKLYSTTLHDNIGYSQDLRYGQSGNSTIAQLSDMLLGLQSGASSFVYCDCSSFAAANYYAFGYTVPITSRAWLGNPTYAARTDWENIVPGDVVRYNGHIEIYVGGGNTIGIGSPQNGVKERAMTVPGTPVAFYRVVQ